MDLSGLSNKEMVATLAAFSTHFKGLRDTNEDAYNALLEQISGKRMNTASMNALLDQMLAGRQNAAPVGQAETNAAKLPRLGLV